jgi:hypothetical protein
MLILKPGQTGTFEFIFNINGSFYDPTEGATPNDVLISVYRGDLGSGAIVDGPFSYLYQDESKDVNIITKIENNTIYYGDYGADPSENSSSLNVVKFSLAYSIPENIFPGNYSVVATTYYQSEVIQYTGQFQVPESSTSISSVYPSGQKELTKSFVPAFDTMDQYSTNSMVLIGHADGIPINSVVRIASIQEAIDLLKADFNSPLLRGIFDAYASGARDIYICAAAPMREYVQDVNLRLQPLPTYAFSDATPLTMNFYQRYYDRLSESYNTLRELDYIDMVVPLETSIVNTGSIDFITQLGLHCQDFFDLTGHVQLGVIGSRDNGITPSGIDLIKSNQNFIDKYTMFDPEGQIIGDMGRFIIPIYGELIMNHSFLNITYVSTGAAVMAAMISSNPVNESLIRKRVSSAFGLTGITLTQKQVDELDALGVNTFTRGTRSRRGNNYQIYITNDNTMADSTSNYRKVPQIRLVSMLINEIRALTSNTVSRFSSQKASDDVRQMLTFLQNNGIILDFSLEAFSDSFDKGKMYFDISVTSTLGLKKISFNIAAGQGA